jgi:hypothetical protein
MGQVKGQQIAPQRVAMNTETCPLCGANVIYNQYGRVCSRVGGPMFRNSNLPLIGPLLALPNQSSSPRIIRATVWDNPEIKGVNLTTIRKMGADGLSGGQWTSQTFTNANYHFRVWDSVDVRHVAVQIALGGDVYKMRLPPYGNEVHPRYVQAIRARWGGTVTTDIGQLFGLLDFVKLDLGVFVGTTPLLEPIYNADISLLTSGQWVHWDTAVGFAGQFGTPGSTGTDWRAEGEYSYWVTRLEGYYWE